MDNIIKFPTKERAEQIKQEEAELMWEAEIYPEDEFDIEDLNPDE